MVSKELVTMLIKCPSTKLLIQEAIAQLNSVSKAVEVFRAEMLRLAQQLPEYSAIIAMYGVGESIGPQLISEIGDIRRFSHKQSLAAFAGVDPMPNQSGTYEAKSTPSYKRGSPELRKTLFVLMTVLLQLAPIYDPVYQFLDKKRSEGKPNHVYMTAGATSFAGLLWARQRISEQAGNV